MSGKLESQQSKGEKRILYKSTQNEKMNNHFLFLINLMRGFGWNYNQQCQGENNIKKLVKFIDIL